MARPCTGSVREREGTWFGSVPRLADAPRRLECAFPTEDEAQRWVDQQLRRRAEGLEPEKPERPARTRRPPSAALRPARRRGSSPPAERPAEGTTLEALAWGWHREYYEEMHTAGADRTEEVRRHIDVHIIPTFAGLLDCDLESGRAMVKDWLRALSGRQPLTPGSSFMPGETYARHTADGHLWLLRQVLNFGRDLGHDIPRYAEGSGIHPLHPVGRPKKRRAPVVSVADTAALAAHLHVIHQTVLWLLRLAGLRISESYGLSVANFFVDVDGDGFLLAEAQGGKKFRQRNDDDEIEVTERKKAGKTDSAYRLIALAPSLTALLLTVIDIFHTRPDGSVDVTARLVPAIRGHQSGQGGFRDALRLAAAGIGRPEDEEAFRVVPHDLRKNFATDLAWSEEVSGLVARRSMGHRAGNDVFDLVYTLDTRLKRHLAPVARQVEQEISAAGLSTLAVPTYKRPVYGSGTDAHHWAQVDAELDAIGWQLRQTADLLSARDAAAYLHRDVKVVRRLFPDKIPAIKIGREWWCTEADVVAFVERTRGYQLLSEVVERAGVDYYAAYRMLHRLGIVPRTDAACRGLLLPDADADRLVAELARIERLCQRLP